ncbi:MAG: hypothetical protein IT285_14030 [Bdellovibrionales bacterium]|nr:hypothetical protein [Bdellovibrionales bacterium]
MRPHFAATLLMLLFSPSARASDLVVAAADWRPRVYQILDGRDPFLFSRSAHAIVSAGCRRPDGSFACDAVRVLSRVRADKIKSVPGGADPGALVCLQQVQGTVVTGRPALLGAKGSRAANLPGGEASFCVLPDKSLVSTGSLDFHAHRNSRPR